MPEADAGPLLRYRREIGAEHIRIFADVKKKHSSHAITADVDIARAAQAAAFFGADAVIVTGPATGEAGVDRGRPGGRRRRRIPGGHRLGASPRTTCPPSGTSPTCSSWVHFIKQDGQWHRPPDPDRVDALLRVVARLR